MAVEGEYLGMQVFIDDLDQENQAFYKHCGKHELRLQQCDECQLKRFPPTTACPFCASVEVTWKKVSGKGTVYSYGEVHHAIQMAFREHTPYMLLLVELDEQRDVPNNYDGLRLQGNLATIDGVLASPDLVKSVGIGTRVKVAFKDIGDDAAMPLWVVDEDEDQPETPWRYSPE
ncbi:MAG: hypothetical protein GXP16_08750 [Gammaproteobacteria bacterium]|nr:hypothetical protein [Gammaproteobacteria bacterium]